jgi:MerR family transcriptional regulator, mercuric resistance operon regulatory protein
MARASQALGLTLGEIRSVVALRDRGETPCGHVLDLLRERADDIGKRIRELRLLKAELARLIDRAARMDPAACAPEKVCHLIG